MRALALKVALAGAVIVAGCSSKGPGTPGHGGSSGGSAGTSGAAGSGDDGAAGTSVDGAAGTVDAAGAENDGAAGTGNDAGAALDAPEDDGASARLAPWQLETDGAPPLVMGIFDRQEQVHCRFLPDQTGQLRCLPWGLATINATTAFSDAACTKPVFLADTTNVANVLGRPTALPLPRVACGQLRYAVGAPRVLSPATAPVFGGKPCAPLPALAPVFGFEPVTVDSLESPTRWATGTAIEGTAIATRMRVHEVETDDGQRLAQRFVDSFVDEHWQKPCHLVPDGQNVSCRPESVSGTPPYIEGAQCAGKPLWTARACADPAYIDVGAGALAIGPAWTGAVSRGGMGCRAVGDPSTVDGPDVFFEGGLTLADDAKMPSVPWQTSGTGRLRLRALTDDAGGFVPFPETLRVNPQDDAGLNGPAAHYFDAVAQTTCNPLRMPDGTLRCVPTTIFASTSNGLVIGFADATCTTTASACPVVGEPCPGLVVATIEPEANGELLMKSLHATRPVTTLFERSGTQCMPSTPSVPLFALAAEQTTWDSFPSFTERNPRAPDGP
jgi:hypothetical protein